MHGDGRHDVAEGAGAGGTPLTATGADAPRHPGDLLLHPAAIGALAVLLFNDHVAKDRWPSEATGKLSDVAGLVVFPLLLVSVVEAVRWVRDRDGWPLGRAALLVAVAVTAIGFVAIKTWGPAADAYRVANGVARWPLDAVPSVLRGRGLPRVGTVRLVEDRTDLVALVALGASWWIGARALRPQRTCSSSTPRGRRLRAR